MPKISTTCTASLSVSDMIIKSSEFVVSAAELSQFPAADGFEIVLIGKSNVGKSSFINAILGRKNLARTSSEPGKTRTANFYRVNDSFYFVDMPGYGYAKTAKTNREVFSKLINDYIMKRKADFMAVQLMDMRHAPEKNDLIMFEKLRAAGVTPAVVLTKKDKLKKSETAAREAAAAAALGLSEDDALFTFSVNDPASVAAVTDFLEGILCSI